ncbi:MAG: hypothetical protein MI702_02980, partial [Chlorobiales bacterium]|nr:hypothetical protein [Chlorobiales bacterium]
VWDVVRESGVSRTSTPVDPDGLTFFDGSPVSFSEDLGMPFAHEFQAGYSRILPYKLKLDAAFIYKINKNAQYRFNRNLIFSGNQFVGLRDESINNDYVFINDELSSKHFQSYELSLTKEFSDNWQLIGSYTYQSSVLKGEWQPDNPLRYLHPADWFDSPDDFLRPHVFRLATHTILPYEITLSSNITFQSGHTDFAKVMLRGTGIDVPRFFTLSNGRTIVNPFWNVSPLFQPRDQDREVNMDGMWIVNLGLGKNFDIANYKIEGQIQVFNLFNGDTAANKFGGNTVDQSGAVLFPSRLSFLQPPRAVQALIKVVF